MRSLFRKIRSARFRYDPLIVVSIYRDRILHNLYAFQMAYPHMAMAPVLKSNAYGHGLLPVATILQKETVPFFCVDSYTEALVLRNEKIQMPLLIIGYTPLENITRSRLKNVSFAITNLEELDRLKHYSGLLSIHLKVDTGMHRQGIPFETLDVALQTIAQNPRLSLEGLYSHFADADTPDSPHTTLQIERWNSCVAAAKKVFPHIRYFHVSNTAGSFHAPHVDANVIRLGVGLYGVNTSQNKNLNVLPALAMRSRITSVRPLHAGESVGYNATFQARNDMNIATIPVGYAEGIDRRLSNKGVVLVRGIPCPIIGRVNMNITSIDISRVESPSIDDEVLVISADRNDPNSIEKIAAHCDTIPYEILVGIPAGLRRVIS